MLDNLITENTKKIEKSSRDIKAKKLKEKRAKRPRPYVVYAGYFRGDLMYIGSGADGRQDHLNSGTSHVYQANQIHFNGGVIDVEVLDRCITKKRASLLEKRRIQEDKPLWNILYSDDSTVVKRYRKVLGDLANDIRYKRKEGFPEMLNAATRSINEDGSCTVSGVIVKPLRLTHPNRDTARIIKYHNVERFHNYVYTLYLDTEFMDEVERNTTPSGQILWTDELKRWGQDRAYTNGYTKVKERGGNCDD